MEAKEDQPLIHKAAAPMPGESWKNMPAAAPAPSAPSAPIEPWNVDAQNMYRDPPPAYDHDNSLHYGAPQHNHESEAEWRLHRERTLREWGRRREQHLHRFPGCFMDQMMSGSGLFPPRLLDPQEWFTEEERGMIARLEELLKRTGKAKHLAMDMMAARIYNIRVKIILDNSGSMGRDMMGEQPSSPSALGARTQWIDEQCPYISVAQRRLYNLDEAFQALFQSTQPCAAQFCCCCAGACGPNGPCPPRPVPQRMLDGIDPRHRRWYFARDHLAKWLSAYRIMGLEPPVYMLNSMGSYRPRGKHQSIASLHTDVGDVFSSIPGGSTPLSEVLLSALKDHEDEAKGAPLLLLILTDGEANSKATFNALLDSIQWGAHGDVQVCVCGLSLVQGDLEWFENEECDDTRIRTVEAFEIEQQQMLRREVIGTEGEYNFDMHVFRSLVTNFFPADYDVEAPVQNMRHRAYVSMHGRDRWWMQSCCVCCGSYKDLETGVTLTDQNYGLCGSTCGLYCCVSKLCGIVCCTPLYLLSCCCCFGYLQGQECFKCRPTECVECLTPKGE